MNSDLNLSGGAKRLQPINHESSSWLTNIDNEFQALVGFGAYVAQSVIGMTQAIGQSEIMCAKINAEASLEKMKVENEGRLQTAMLEKESHIIASIMPIFQEEIKRLGARIDSLSAIILEKYSAIDLSQTQQKERENIESLSNTTKNCLTIFCNTLWRSQKFNCLTINCRMRLVSRISTILVWDLLLNPMDLDLQVRGDES